MDYSLDIERKILHFLENPYSRSTGDITLKDANTYCQRMYYLGLLSKRLVTDEIFDEAVYKNCSEIDQYCLQYHPTEVGKRHLYELLKSQIRGKI